MNTIQESLRELNQEDKSFGDFLYDLLKEDQFIMLRDYINKYIRKLTSGLGSYNERNYRYYKQRLIKKLEEINSLEEEDKKLNWEELHNKYLNASEIKTELKKGNIKPYEIFYKLWEKEMKGTPSLLPNLDR